METYDLIVIGAGPGGYVAAIRAAQLGLKTCLIDKRETLGGTCLNVGCIPSKALLESSEAFAFAQHKAAEHGIAYDNLRFDLAAMLARKDKVVGELTSGLTLLMRKNKIDTLRGVARLLDNRRVAVRLVGEQEGEQRELGAKNILLAAGSVPIELPFLPFDSERIVSSTEALCFEEVPRHLAIVGAGAIGLELGSVWCRLGAKVTVLERLPRIVPAADHEMTKLLQRLLTKQGLVFEMGCSVTGAEVQDEGVKLKYTTASGEEASLDCDRVLVAVGRRPASEELGLEAAGVSCERGQVVIDHHYRTSVPTIYAIGDLVSGPMLAHKAEEEGAAAAEIIASKPGHVNYEAIPNVVYTWPELAEVGVSEQTAKERGFDVRIGRYKFAANGRAKTLGESEGMVKLVADRKTDRLLGAHIVGPRASDMIAELVMAMEFSASAEDVARTSHAHPTLAEIVKEAALSVGGRVLHG